jgi:tetratricopeptide (TPR) repeat protein
LQGEEGDAVARGVAILEKLVGEFPNIPQYQFDLSEAYEIQSRRPGSIERLEKAGDILRKLADQWPHVPSYRFALAHMHLRLSFARDREGQQPELVLAELRRAIDLQTALVKQFPSVATYAMMAAYYESAMAAQCEERSQHEQARTLLESAAGRMDALAVTVGYKPRVRWIAMHCYEELANVYERLGETKLSQDAWQRAEAMRMPPSSSSPWGPPPATGPFRLGPLGPIRH